jgi:hypothetical protein
MSDDIVRCRSTIICLGRTVLPVHRATQGMDDCESVLSR